MAVDQKISEMAVATLSGTEMIEVVQGGVNKRTDPAAIAALGGGAVTSVNGQTGVVVLDVPTREFNRTFSETLVFDKNEIFHSPVVQTGPINLEIGAGGLVNQASSMRFRMTMNGTDPVNFGAGFDYLYGITNGEILAAGTYEFYFLYTNGSVSVSFPGVSEQSSGAVTLAAPANFAAVPATAPDNETELDLTWDNVTSNEGYLVEFSTTGTGGWSTLITTAVDAVATSQAGLAAGNIRFYRIKTLGDGVATLDSAFSSVISGQTESSGDVTPPTFIFLPASGNVVWTVNRPITITANEPIQNTDGSEITNANVASRIILKETNAGGTNIAFTATIDGTKQIITITPTTQYGEVQLVFVAINNVEDVNGNEVTVAISSTFTTTDYAFLDGTSNRLQFGDILDSLFAASNTNFWLEVSVRNMLLSGTRILVAKYDTSGNQRAFYWYSIGTDVYFGWVGTVSGGNNRVIKWTNVLTAGDHTFVLKYDGSIATNDGLDRVTLLIDAGTAGSKTLFLTQSGLSAIANSTAQLAVGAFINNAGTPIGSNFYTEEMKDFIVRSTGGTVVVINVPNLKTGVDTSGNANHGTWV